MVVPRTTAKQPIPVNTGVAMSRPTKKDWIDQVATQQLRIKQLCANGVLDFPDQEIIFDVNGYAIDMREPKLDFRSNGNGTPHTHNDNSYPIGPKIFFGHQQGHHFL